MSKQIIAALRSAMLAKGLSAYVIPATDPHASEYLPEHWRCLHWASGFSGSAGTLVITKDFAGLWTDSRYFIQAEQQLQGSSVELVKLKIPHTAEFADWLADTLSSGDIVGTDGNLMARNWYQLAVKALTPRGIVLDPAVDLISPIWKNRPLLPTAHVHEHPAKFVGANRAEKIKAVRDGLKRQKAEATLLSSLDDIAWLFNLRGNDVPYNPLFVAHAVVAQKSVALFIDHAKVPADVLRKLQRDGVKVLPYENTLPYLQQFPKGAMVLIDPKRISQNLPGALPAGTKILETTNISTLLKACKSEKEAAHTRQTMVYDGVVLSKFFYWLSQHVDKEHITELSATEKLHALRKAQPNNVGESFGTIAAYGEHAALPHYSSTPESNVQLKPEGLFLLDSGGQFLGGTTDTTRVISLGNITPQEKTDYTLVLKGLIAVCLQRFPAGTKGHQLDALARMAMWQEGINYGHGTGHGVGYFLNVHEGPQSISPAASDAPLQPGMITSVEPGIYRTGKHGIRLENLVLCVEDETTEFGAFLRFEVLTLAPIFTNLVDFSLLDRTEKTWLRKYNQLVLRKVGRYLTAEEKDWVKLVTT